MRECRSRLPSQLFVFARLIAFDVTKEKTAHRLEFGPQIAKCLHFPLGSASLL